MKVVYLFFFLLLAGCVSAPIAPNLKLPEFKPQECRSLNMPAIPNTVHITITGDKYSADNGGILLLRYYVKARDILRPN